jgi:hypothetical protein
MSDKEKLTPREAMAREKARLLEEAAAIDRDMAEYDRISAKYNLGTKTMDGKPRRKQRADKESHKRQANDRQFADGSVANLANRYLNDKRSPYPKLRYRTRQHYRSLIKRIVLDCGEEKIADLKAQNIQLLYEGWTISGAPMARALIGMFRMMINFGTTIQEADCERLSGIMHNMRFKKIDEPRNDKMLTVNQAARIIKKAHEMGLHSIALAQAFQFDCMLRQRDVIGEWVPNSEDGVSVVTYRNEKWLRGIRWSEIDGNLILRHTTSKKLESIEVNLRDAPLVMAEFARIPEFARNGTLPQSGPVIVSEQSGRPYTGWAFRMLWRKMADAADIPKDVKNMDSRRSGKSDRKSSEYAEVISGR